MPLNSKEYDYFLTNNSKYLHYMEVTESNALSAKFLSKHDGYRFRLNCLVNFHSYKKFKQYQKLCRNRDHAEIETSKKFKTILNKETNEVEEVPENIYSIHLK